MSKTPITCPYFTDPGPGCIEPTGKCKCRAPTETRRPAAWVNGEHLDKLEAQYGDLSRPLGHQAGDDADCWDEEREIAGCYSYGQTRLRKDGYHDTPLYRVPPEMVADDWRKGVGLIASALGEDTLSCVHLAERALELRAEIERLRKDHKNE